MKKRNSILTMTIAFAMAIPSAFALASLFEVKDVKQVHATGTVELSTLTGDYVAQDGDVLTGTLGEHYKISVADGATVTLNNATIDLYDELYTSLKCAGIELLGDATLILSGTNKISPQHKRCPAIRVLADKTVTIDAVNDSAVLDLTRNSLTGGGIGGGDNLGDVGNIIINKGTINVNGGSQAAAIGGSRGSNCGTITINGGTINANAVGTGIGGGWGSSCAGIIINGGNITASGTFVGIGLGHQSPEQTGVCGDIVIKGGTINAGGGEESEYETGIMTSPGSTVRIEGGTVIAKGGFRAAGIGSYHSSHGGDILISGGNVTAVGGNYSAGIGSGNEAQCDNITITGGTVTATGGTNAPGIGSGYKGSCGNITINKTVTLLTSTKGTDASYSVGQGNDGSCGTITIGGETSESKTEEVFTYPLPHTHNFTYSKFSDNTILATCLNDDCPLEGNELKLTLQEPTNSVYDGTNKVCSFVAGYSEAAFGTPSIEYYENNSLVSECVNAGTYEARVTVGGATAKVQFEITQATPTGYDIPTGLEAVYGDKLSSVTLPEHWSWKNPNDLVGNAGERTHAAIYTPEDPNYKAVEVNVTVTVAKANPTYVVPSTIDAPYNVELSTIGLPEGFFWMDGTQKTSTWGESTFKAKYTPSDTVNYNVVENIDIKVNVKWILVDPTEGDVSVTIKDGETEYNVDISVKVEVKTEVTIDEKRTEYASIGREFIKQDEDINAIYSVKLIRTVGGVQTEIQPSDIKEGTKIIVSMPVPEQLVSKPFRLLEIFNSSEAKEFSNSEYAITGDGKTLMVEVDRMGEFAFISHTDTDNGFIYTTGGGIPVVVVIFIVLGAIILSLGIAYVLMMFVFNKWIRKDDKALRAVMLGKKDNKVRLLVMPFRFEYRQEAEVFDTKQEALKE